MEFQGAIILSRKRLVTNKVEIDLDSDELKNLFQEQSKANETKFKVKHLKDPTTFSMRKIEKTKERKREILEMKFSDWKIQKLEGDGQILMKNKRIYIPHTLTKNVLKNHENKAKFLRTHLLNKAHQEACHDNTRRMISIHNTCILSEQL